LKNAHQNLQAMLTSNLPLSRDLQISDERNCPQNWSPLYLAWSNCINYCCLVFLSLSTWSVAHYQTPHLNSNQSHPHTSTNTKFTERTSKLGPQHCMNWCLQITPKPSYIYFNVTLLINFLYNSWGLVNDLIKTWRVQYILDMLISELQHLTHKICCLISCMFMKQEHAQIWNRHW